MSVVSVRAGGTVYFRSAMDSVGEVLYLTVLAGTVGTLLQLRGSPTAPLGLA